jgi:hypothetical protein
MQGRRGAKILPHVGNAKVKVWIVFAGGFVDHPDIR